MAPRDINNQPCKKIMFLKISFSFMLFILYTLHSDEALNKNLHHF